MRLIEIGQRQHELLTDSYRQILESLLDALESRDAETNAHSRRVSAYATRLTLELDPSLLDDPTLEWGFLLHDIGKIGIPDSILLKPGPLDSAERRIIEKHPLIGHRLVGAHPVRPGPRDRGHPLASRALGRARLSGRAEGRPHPAGRAHLPRRGRARRDDRQAPLP